MSLIPLLIAAVGLVASPYGVRASIHNDDALSGSLALAACLFAGAALAAAAGVPLVAGTAVGGTLSALAVTTA